MPQATAAAHRNRNRNGPFSDPGRDAAALFFLVFIAAIVFLQAMDIAAYFRDIHGKPAAISHLFALVLVGMIPVASRFPIPDGAGGYPRVLKWSFVAALIAMVSVFASYVYVAPLMENGEPTEAERAGIEALQSQLRQMDAQIEAFNDRKDDWSKKHKTKKDDLTYSAQEVVNARAAVAAQLAAAVASASAPDPGSFWRTAIRSTNAVSILALRVAMDLALLMLAAFLSALYDDAGGDFAPEKTRAHDDRRVLETMASVPAPARSALPEPVPEPEDDPPPPRRAPAPKSDAPVDGLAVSSRKFRLEGPAVPAPATAESTERFLGMTPRDFLRLEWPRATAKSISGDRKGPYVVWADPATRKTQLGRGRNAMEAYEATAAKHSAAILRNHGTDSRKEAAA